MNPTIRSLVSQLLTFIGDDDELCGTKLKLISSKKIYEDVLFEIEEILEEITYDKIRISEEQLQYFIQNNIILEWRGVVWNYKKVTLAINKQESTIKIYGNRRNIKTTSERIKNAFPIDYEFSLVKYLISRDFLNKIDKKLESFCKESKLQMYLKYNEDNY